MSEFILTPPFAVVSDVSVSLIQVGDMAAPESLVICLGSWSSVDLFAHWTTEVGALLDRKRNCCCIVSGLVVLPDKVVPTAWWTFFAFDSEVRVQYQVLNTQEIGSSCAWNSPEDWWKNIPDYQRFSDDGDGMREISEWIVPIDRLASWHRQNSALGLLIRSVQDDPPE